MSHTPTHTHTHEAEANQPLLCKKLMAASTSLASGIMSFTSTSSLEKSIQMLCSCSLSLFLPVCPSLSLSLSLPLPLPPPPSLFPPLGLSNLPDSLTTILMRFANKGAVDYNVANNCVCEHFQFLLIISDGINSYIAVSCLGLSIVAVMHFFILLKVTFFLVLVTS